MKIDSRAICVGSERQCDAEGYEHTIDGTLGDIQEQADDVRSTLGELNRLLQQQMQLSQHMQVVKAMRTLQARVRDNQQLLRTFTQQQALPHKQ